MHEKGEYGKYIEANSSTVRAGSFYSTVNLNIPSSGSYILEFDAAIGNTNTTSISSFYILTEQANTNSYLLKMDSDTYINGENNLNWKIN